MTPHEEPTVSDDAYFVTAGRPNDGVRVTAHVLQAPVGDSPQAKEPTVSDGEREGVIDVLVMSPMSNFVGNDMRPIEKTADALIAAGYRKAPVVSVEDVARAVERHLLLDIERCICGCDGLRSVHIATAVLALLEGGDRG